MKNCPICGNEYTTAQQKEKSQKESIKFTHNGKVLTANALRYNDAFYEIIGGKYNGNLVHICNLIKN